MEELFKGLLNLAMESLLKPDHQPVSIATIATLTVSSIGIIVVRQKPFALVVENERQQAMTGVQVIAEYQDYLGKNRKTCILAVTDTAGKATCRCPLFCNQNTLELRFKLPDQDLLCHDGKNRTWRKSYFINTGSDLLIVVK